jgi:hypothetical protein
LFTGSAHAVGRQALAGSPDWDNAGAADFQIDTNNHCLMGGGDSCNESNKRGVNC